MIIERVHLENFISHSSTEIHFPAGVTAIIGPNGAGKTSIIDGIIFALFNERVRGDRMTDIIMRGTERAKVELVFSESGSTYRIVRTRSRKAGDAEIYRGDTLIARTQSDVTKEISRILSIDKETLMNSVFIRQGEIASLIDASPAERKRLISRFIGIDKLETAWQNMLEVVRHFEDKAKRYDVIKAVIDEKKKVLKRLSDDLRSIRQDIERKKRELDDLKVEFERVMREFAHLKALRRRYEELSEMLLRLGEREKALREKISRAERDLRDAEHASEEMRALEPFILKMKHLERYVKVSAEIERLKYELRRTREERAEIKRLMDDMIQNESDHAKFIEIDSKLERMRDDERRIRAYEMRFMALESRKDALNAAIERKEEEIEEIRNHALNFLRDATVAAKEERMKEIDDLMHEAERALRASLDERGWISGRLNEIAKNMRMIEEAMECPVCRRPLDDDHKKRVRHMLEEEEQMLADDLKRIEREIAEKRDEIERIRKERDAISMIDVARLEMLMKELRREESEMSQIARAEAELKDKVQELERLRADISRLEEEKKKYERGYREYIAAEKALSGKNLDEIDREMQRLYEEMMNYEAEAAIIVEELGYKPENADEALREMREKKERYEVLKAKASDAERLRAEIEALKEEYRRLSAEISEKGGEMEMLGFSAERYEGCERRYHEIAAEVKAIEMAIRSLKERAESEERRRRSEESELEMLRNELASLSRLRDFVRVLSEIRDVFSKDKAQRMLRQRISPIISEYMREFIERFNIDISDVTMNEDFEIRVMKRGGEISARAMSGGEKVAVALSLRLAIAKALSSRISSIIMDEPTTHLDEERRRELVEILKYFFKGARSILPQMVIVTHHREIEDAADNIILVENIGGISRVRAV